MLIALPAHSENLSLYLPRNSIEGKDCELLIVYSRVHIETALKKIETMKC